MLTYMVFHMSPDSLRGFLEEVTGVLHGIRKEVVQVLLGLWKACLKLISCGIIKNVKRIKDQCLCFSPYRFGNNLPGVCEEVIFFCLKANPRDINITLTVL